MSHVPEESLHTYRRYMRLSTKLDALGDEIGPNDFVDSEALWAMSGKYKEKAQALRVLTRQERMKND